MLKFNNTWETNPHMTQLLETELYERRRRIKGMSQDALANKIGVSRNCIYLIESHENIPKIETILHNGIGLHCRRTQNVYGKIHRSLL